MQAFLLRRQILGVLRLLAYFTLLTCALLVLTVFQVKAEARESSLRLGRGLNELRDVLGRSSPILVNGSLVYAGARHVRLDLKSVLDKFEIHCSAHGWLFTEELEQLANARKQKLPEEFGRISFTLGRRETEDEGMVMCILAPNGVRGTAEFLARAQLAANTGELSHVGDLRYVFARKNSATSGTDVITVWSDGPLNIREMTRTERDVPGQDLDAVPRPPNSIRILSAELVGSQYAVRSYTTKAPLDENLTRYETLLTRQGFKLVPVPNASRDSWRAFLKDGAAIIIAGAATHPGSRIDIVQLGSRGFANEPIRSGVAL